MSTDIDDETAWLVQTLAGEVEVADAAIGLMIERLRRMEDEARLEGAGRQTLQKIMSARRLLGDRLDFGRVSASFSAE